MIVHGFLPYLLSAWLLCWGLYGVVSSRNWVHLCICLAVVQSGTYMLLLGVGYRYGGTAPVFDKVGANTTFVDPVVQALMLTDIVVEATVVALLLALAVRAHQRTGTLDPGAALEMRG